MLLFSADLLHELPEECHRAAEAVRRRIEAIVKHRLVPGEGRKAAQARTRPIIVLILLPLVSDEGSEASYDSEAEGAFVE